MLIFCPSPLGIGLHDLELKNFFVEKLLNETPMVPTTIPAPQPPESSNWSDDVSSTVYSISTVPSMGFGFGFIPIVSWLKYLSCANSLWERIMSARLNSCPGTVRSSLNITWSLVLVFPIIEILFILACFPSLILISISMESFSIFTSTGVAEKKRYPSSRYSE